MKDIVVVAPFKDLYDLSNKIIKEKGYQNIEVVLGNLSQGVVEAKKIVEKGASLIISRGGTYTMIKNVVNIPVVEIKMTSFDILRGFKNIISYKGTIGVVGYKNIIHDCEIIQDILGLDMVKIEIEREEDAEENIRYYVEKGVKVFVGDTVASKVSKKLNCVNYMITSGEEAVLNAMQEARRILQMSKIEKEKAQRFKTIMDFVHDGIISIDDNGKISIINSRAEKIFGLNEKNVIGKNIEDVVKNSKLPIVLRSGISELGEIQEVGQSKIATNRVPIIVDDEIKGVVATFQDVTELQNLEKKVRLNLLKKGFVAKYNFNQIVYKSKKTEECIERAKKYSKYDSPILIIGPSGVGKELFAQSIHNYSHREKGPFVAINCAALPPNLIESELFGYVEGAFTGAAKGGKAGIFELAHGGTIFLDEIGELPLELQGRLLRVLQEREVMRIGDDKVLPVDVRVISATNKNLRGMVEKGEFREDLYFRINILSLKIPSLNERAEDIEQLSQCFIKKYSSKYNKPVKSMDKGVLNLLLKYCYKGNIRELEGIIQRAVILAEKEKLREEDIILEEDFKGDFRGKNACSESEELFKEEDCAFKVKKDINLKELENQYIKYILQKCNGSVNRASEVLDVNRSTIWRKLREN
ncbi:sigma 54-interacting transcriptional regulator [Clostridium sp. MSJ-11]|uniref:Sigma 54-interacting transcriptional regulator n=1 Tax=Clostridium mobile TaxID=2841512 RepID=A0ABS6EHR3_9CLOT|nr:sigma 54-interacting transcriptional regulator [Clostridium mobile]MBU5484763.1 sigma 54-interacting transcriptional regulator [Clostridium mobile]